MLAGNVMPGSHDGAFEQGKEGFGGFGRSPGPIRVLALIFSARVIDRLMCFPLLQWVFVTGCSSVFTMASLLTHSHKAAPRFFCVTEAITFTRAKPWRWISATTGVLGLDLGPTNVSSTSTVPFNFGSAQ